MSDENVPPQDQKPLVPRTAAGAAIVGIPLASILAFAGWAGEKLLALDEITVQHAEQIEKQSLLLDEVRVLGVKIDERLVRAETRLEKIEEIQHDRSKFFERDTHKFREKDIPRVVKDPKF
jgi:hypothetical protein